MTLRTEAEIEALKTQASRAIGLRQRHRNS